MKMSLQTRKTALTNIRRKPEFNWKVLYGCRIQIFERAYMKVHNSNWQDVYSMKLTTMDLLIHHDFLHLPLPPARFIIIFA